MEWGTLFGLVGWIVCILFSIIQSGNSVLTYYDFASVLCTIGGSYFSLMLQYGVKDCITIFKIMGRTFRKYNPNVIGLVKQLQDLSEKARREGLLALEEMVEEIDDLFLKNGLKLVVDGTDAEVIRTLMENEVNGMNSRHEHWIKMLNAWSLLAPGFGMLGTVLGLIGMLKNLADKSTVGPNMAVALITTFYGAIMANALFIPMMGKLGDYDAVETTFREMAIEGVLSIQAGDNPRIMTLRLLSYLDPATRSRLEGELLKD
jgi:chemotaxis protein MotA